MLSTFIVVAPIFALIALGYSAVRFRLYPAAGVPSLIAFVNNFATPCLLFNSMVNSDFTTAFNIGIIGPFYLGAFLCFGLGIFVGIRLFGDTRGESVASGFSAMFSNTVLVGLPILQRAYGEDALPVAFSIIGIHGAILLTSAMLTMELMRRDGRPLTEALGNAGKRIVSNPLLWGIALGLSFNFAGIGLIEPASAFFSMMAQAVVPVALFGIGGALNQYKLSENWSQALVISLIKLFVHPAIAYVLMIWVLRVDMQIARYGILMSAMPAGINSYVFATYYNRGVSVAANVVLIGTVGSALSIALWLYILGH
ncbi:malonate transporter [Devosia pacifica]|uniref:Malonate transporter n=1 Tax=Devosia pacifica TaxID=1335967 RepID=A0A918S8L0_9HYPH|nr:AEC family transporter [Devosia pacifica]GHA26361.1 malonate transporter [Devosia pacifica]